MANDTKRGRNFTEAEKCLLIDLVIPHKKIIENIKTDGITNKCKDATWIEISDTYNSQQESGIRSIRQLKSLYDVLKRKARKDKSDNRVELYKTGGGCNFSSLSNSTQKVLGVLGDRVDPLQNDTDCDTDYPQYLDEDSVINDYDTAFNDDHITIVETTIGEDEYETVNLPNYHNRSVTSITPVSKKRSPEILKLPEKQIIKTFDKQSVTDSIQEIGKKIVRKDASIKKVYEGLQQLTTKHLLQVEGKEKVTETLNSLKLRKAQLKLCIAETENNIIISKQEADKKQYDSENRQNNLKEQILESELKQHKMKEAILLKQLTN